MSLIKSILHQLGLSATPANNFTLDASADNGTMKLARGNAGETTQDILTVDAAGKVAFPQMAQQLSGTGYADLPGGLILQWGFGDSAAGIYTFSFPKAFPNAIFQVVAVCAVTANVVAVLQAQSVSGASILTHIGSTGAAATTPVLWFAIGF